MPHSHNDPGWLKTFINYFHSETRDILNCVIAKMHEFKDMTFIWSEISFLQLWWDQASPTEQSELKALVDQGRFEITTGGWVMADEANVHVYAMVNQLIEGKARGRWWPFVFIWFSGPGTFHKGAELKPPRFGRYILIVIYPL